MRDEECVSTREGKEKNEESEIGGSVKRKEWRKDGLLIVERKKSRKKAMRKCSKRTWAGGKRRDEGHEHEDGELLHVDDLGIQPQVEHNQLHQTTVNLIRWMRVCCVSLCDKSPMRR